MAAIPGKGGTFHWGANEMSEIQNWSLDIGVDMLDDTSMGDSWKTFIAGLKEWSASVEVNWDLSDTAQGAANTAALAGTSATVKLYVDEANTKYYTGTAYISSMPVETPKDDKVTLSFELQGSGAITYETS